MTWIKVTDKLPESEAPVLVCIPEEIMTIGVYGYRNGVEIWYHWEDHDTLVDVTHWMELPKLPSGGVMA